MGRKPAELKIICSYDENAGPLCELIVRCLQSFIREELGKDEDEGC